MSRPSRARQLAANAWITARTVVHHVTDDPVVFWLQVSRRLPPRVVAPAGRVLRRLPARRFPAAHATGRHLAGQHEAACAVLSAAAGHPRPGVRRRGAEVALSMGEAGLARALLDTLPDGARAAAATRARVAWFHGDVDAAVAGLQRAVASGTATRGERSLAGRLASERELLGAFTVHLDPVPDYVARQDTVVHVVTNSLPHTSSGYAQRTHNVLTALAAEGWTVHAVTRPGYPVQVGKVLARDVDVVDGIPYHRILPANLAATATGRVEQQARALLELALRVRPAVLHTTSHYVNAIATRAVAEALGIPWVYEVRGLLADTWASTRCVAALDSQRYRRFQACEARALLGASRVVTLAATMAGRLREITDRPDLRVDLAPNAVGGVFLRPSLSPHEAREQLGLSSDAFLVGTVTSVVDYEGLDDVLRAAALVRDSLPGLRVVIVGDGVALPGLRTMADELGLAGIVSFPGRVDRETAAQYLRALDVVTVVRKDRTVTRAVTPLKPVEAMASGAVVVASDLPALREVVQDGVTGLLTPPEDPAALAEVLRRLAREPGTRHRLTTAARKWVMTHRTWAVTARETAARYREVIRDVPRTSHKVPTPEEPAP